MESLHIGDFRKNRTGFVMNKIILGIVIFFLPLSLFAQVTSDLSLTASPAVDIPIGPSLDDGTNYYSIGGGVNLRVEYVMPFMHSLFASGNIDFDLVPINGSDSSMTLLAGGFGLGMRHSPIQRMTLRAGGYGGMYMGIIDEGSVRNPFAAAAAEVSYMLNPSLNIGLGGVYKHHFTPDGPVYQGISITLGASYNVGAGKRKADLYVEPLIQPIFPLFYSYYDNNPAGKIRFVNNERSAIQDVRVSFLVKQYMEQAKLCGAYPAIDQGESLDVPVYALFTDTIFNITEGTKVAGEIIVDYTYIGREMTNSYPVTVTINNRNAMVWDDDRKAAAFVTSKDPLVLSFSKNIAGSIRSDDIKAVNSDFRTAMAIFEALGIYGVGYVVDPSTPYSVLSEDSSSLDFIQFPNQTLAYKAGDCDDMTILYSALLEAVGIETAFITAPGHIYMAFNLDMSPAAAGRVFSSTADLITLEDETWLPVEITLVADGFLKAWQIGAKEWRETDAAGTAGFFPVRESWKLYEPVGFAQGAAAIVLPDSERVAARYKSTLERFINREIGPRVETLQAKIRSGGNTVVYRNKLGILYAQFGMLDEAASQFKSVASNNQYVPALINLGNIYYLKDEMETALSYYKQALQKAPDNAVALLGVARASYELEDYQAVDNSLAKLESESPQMAAQFSYLGSGTGDVGRASQALEREVSVWDEE